MQPLKHNVFTGNDDQACRFGSMPVSGICAAKLLGAARLHSHQGVSHIGLELHSGLIGLVLLCNFICIAAL